MSQVQLGIQVLEHHFLSWEILVAIAHLIAMISFGHNRRCTEKALAYLAALRLVHLGVIKPSPVDCLPVLSADCLASAQNALGTALTKIDPYGSVCGHHLPNGVGQIQTEDLTMGSFNLMFDDRHDLRLADIVWNCFTYNFSVFTVDRRVGRLINSCVLFWLLILSNLFV